MKVGGDDDADNNSNNAAELNMIVGRDAIGEVLGDLAIEKDDGAADSQNNKTNNHPSNTERPVDFHIPYNYNGFY